MYRQNLKDEYYTRKSKQDHYPARSIYKLQGIDQKFGLIRKNDKILDLGCAPGSWLLYAAKKGEVLGIDSVDLKIVLPPSAKFIRHDVMSFTTDDKFNVIISDLSPNTSGDHFVDVANSIELCERCLEIAKNSLKKNGNFLCKIFEGEGINEFFKKVAQSFKLAKRYKPMASRKESREIYIVGIKFNG